jgi:orotate phosphoribosyltransferase
MPMAYVRAKVKDHGRAKAIEGELKLSCPVVVIEDLLSTGNSCLEVVKILRTNKINVLGVVSIFNYGMKPCIQNFKKNKCIVYSLCNLDELIVEATKQKFISKQESKQILNFRDEPSNSQ